MAMRLNIAKIDIASLNLWREAFGTEFVSVFKKVESINLKNYNLSTDEGKFKLTVEFANVGISAEVGFKALTKLQFLTSPNVYIVMELRKPRAFSTEEVALAAIEEAKAMRGPDYYRGSFVVVNSIATKMFHFQTTLPAKSASVSDFRLGLPKLVRTDRILKPIRQLYLTVLVDATCVSQSQVQSALLNERKRVIRDAIEIYKKKRTNESDFVDEIQSIGAPQANWFETHAYELSKFNFIVQQFETSAKCYDISVYSNTKEIGAGVPKKMHFSKYEESKPDMVSYNTWALVGSKDYSRWCYIRPPENRHDDDGDDVDIEIFSNRCVVTETKTGSRVQNDPVGQLFAGVDKVIADLVYGKLVVNELLEKLTLFSIYIDPEDMCEVHLFNIELNQETAHYQGSEKLTINDTLNKVLGYLIVPDPTT